MSSLIKYEDGFQITINDYMDLIIKTPQITQVFAKAVAQFVASTVVGVVAQIIVTIGEESNKIDYIQHEQKVKLHIAKLSTTTQHYAEAYLNAENNPGYPQAMKEELKNALYRQFYDEMRNLSPRRG